MPTGRLYKPILSECLVRVCVSSFCVMSHWVWESGHHGNGLSLQVVCNGMRSLWAQFVCLYLSLSFSSSFHPNEFCKKQKDRPDWVDSFGTG